jgi:hypothetical protein
MTMGENSEFFTAVSGSPSYSADSVCKWLYDRTFQGDGVLKGLYNSLAVTSDGAGNALIATGSASKTGHGYYNDSVLTKALTLPASGYTNINSLVVRVDSSTSPNTMHVVVLVGSSVANGSTPTAPSITTGSDIYLADIRIVNTAGSYVYTVTDQRVYCPVMPANGLMGSGWETALENACPANLTLPIGTILMFDANATAGSSGGGSGAWVDNGTMAGWYACIAANSVWACPDLTSKFVMGKVVDGAGATGGSNSHTISVTELPSHTHNVVLGSHTHTYNIPDDAGASIVYVANGTGRGNSSHTTGSTDLGTKTTDGAGGGIAIDIRPAYYSVIFIRRCV